MPTRGASVPCPTMSIAGKPAKESYMECKARGGLPPLEKSDRARATISNAWFDAMATPEERTLLSPPPPQRDGTVLEVRDEGERRRLVTVLHDHVLDRLTKAYKDAGIDVPRDALVSRLSALKPFKVVATLQTLLISASASSKVVKASPIQGCPPNDHRSALVLRLQWNRRRTRHSRHQPRHWHRHQP